MKLANAVKDTFVEMFINEPLLVFSPGRINLIGEHTDYNEGYVFPAAVDKGVYAAIQKTDANNSTAVALDIDKKIEFDVNNIPSAKAGKWENYLFGVVAELLKCGKNIPNFNIIFKGDIPLGAGMSSSAALENSIVFGLNALFNLQLSKKDMIRISQKAEHNYVGVNCGIMDQYASMFGIENNALHLDCRHVESKPYEINFEDHELVLVNTNVKHSLSDSAYNNRRAACEHVSSLLGVKALRDTNKEALESISDKISEEDYNKALYVIEENTRTLEAAKAIEKGDLKTLGHLIYKSHEGLSEKYKVSCAELDFLVNEAKKHPYVLGARMMGGGFGGCTINLVRKDQTENFTKAIAKAYESEFKKACSIYHVKLSNGTHLLN